MIDNLNSADRVNGEMAQRIRELELQPKNIRELRNQSEVVVMREQHLSGSGEWSLSEKLQMLSHSGGQQETMINNLRMKTE